MDDPLLEQFKNAGRKSVHFAYHLILDKFQRIFEKEKGRQLFAQSHPPLVKLVDFNNVRFGIYIPTHGVIEDHILQHGNWSGDLLQLTDCFITPNSTIIEVGANIGFESLYYARKYPDCLIYSYEPGSYAHDTLLRSKSYNHLDNLRVFKLAVGERSGSLEIATPTESSKNKGLGSLKANQDLDDSYVKEQIEMVTLDAHCTPDRRVSVLKIDTQGFEWNVLQGATALIAKHRPVILFEHEDHYHENAIVTRQHMGAFFDRAGYDLYLPAEGMLKSLDFAGMPHLHGDVIALPRH